MDGHAGEGEGAPVLLSSAGSLIANAPLGHLNQAELISAGEEVG